MRTKKQTRIDKDRFKTLKRILNKDALNSIDVKNCARIVFYISHQDDYMCDPEIRQLRDDALALVQGFTDGDQLADRVARDIDRGNSDSMLEYEEMDAEFSRYEVITALEYVGFPFDPALKAEWKAAVRKFFARNKKHARISATRRAEPWNAHFWFIRENLSEKTLGALGITEPANADG